MRNFLRKILIGGSIFSLGLALAGGVTGLISAPVAADTYQGNIIDAETDDGDGIYFILDVIVNILVYGVGVAGIIGLVICGIQYMTSQGDVAKMKQVKIRIVEIVIGLVLYAFLYALLNWLIPGGLTTIF